MRRFLRKRAEQAARALVANRLGRAAANGVYRRLSFPSQAMLHSRLAKIFRDRQAPRINARWRIRFGPHDVSLPLKTDRLWLDWDHALSALGHEPEIKQTYVSLLKASVRPDLFIDVGANFGIHSLLFLAAGIPAVSFEPNAYCHTVFRDLCALNHVVPRIEPVAVGQVAGVVNLTFPEREEWLGSTDDNVRERLENGAPVRTVSVAQRCLDEYLEEFHGKRMLLKIDTEGSEMAVLRGATRLLHLKRPTVIFESWPDNKSRRRQVFEVLADAGYVISALPWDGAERRSGLSLAVFLDHAAYDFLATGGRQAVGQH